jgi:hypothetical protein
MWVVVNIGCIECGVSSNIVGVFDQEQYANDLATLCQEAYGWREHGQNAFEVFPLPPVGVIHPEYQIERVGIALPAPVTK